MNEECWRTYLWNTGGELRLESFEVIKNRVEDNWRQREYLSLNRVRELTDEFDHEDEGDCFDKDVTRLVHLLNVQCTETGLSSNQSDQVDAYTKNHERCDSIVDEHRQRSTERQPSLVLWISSGKFHRASREDDDDDASTFLTISARLSHLKHLKVYVSSLCRPSKQWWSIPAIAADQSNHFVNEFGKFDADNSSTSGSSTNRKRINVRWWKSLFFKIKGFSSSSSVDQINKSFSTLTLTLTPTS